MGARARRAAAACWAFGLALACAAARAQPASEGAPERALLLEPAPAGVAERIEGQTSDLPWRIERADGGERPTLARARQLALERGARAVLWAAEDAHGLVLRVLDARRSRLLERRFDRDTRGGGQAQSAALEALALAVRSTLRALTQAEEVGAPVDAGADGAAGASGTPGVAAGSAPPSATRASSAGAPLADGGERAEPPPEVAHDAPSPRTAEGGAGSAPDDAPSPAWGGRAPAWVAAAGWSAALDGHSPAQHGPSARVALAFDRLELGVAGDLALGARLSDAQTRVTLQRRVLLARVGYDLLRAAELRATLALGLGVALFARDTERVGSGLSATRASDLTAAVALLELGGALRVLGDAVLGLELELWAGVLASPAAPVLRYAGEGGQVDRTLWAIQPALRAGPCLRGRL